MGAFGAERLQVKLTYMSVQGWPCPVRIFVCKHILCCNGFVAMAGPNNGSMGSRCEGDPRIMRVCAFMRVMCMRVR